MTPMNYVDPPGRDWELRPVAVVTSDAAYGAAVARQMQNAKQQHFGLFAGWLGELGGFKAAVAASGGGEDPTYVAVRQLSFLFRPQLVLFLGGAIGAMESLLPGDVAWVRQARRCFHPVAVADNMFHDDEALFNSEDLRAKVLDAPVVGADPNISASIKAGILAPNYTAALQQEFPWVSVGSSDRPPARFRGVEFARTRYGVQALDQGSYGFLAALQDEELTGAALLQMRAGCSSEHEAEFQLHAARFEDFAATVLQSVLRILPLR